MKFINKLNLIESLLSSQSITSTTSGFIFNIFLYFPSINFLFLVKIKETIPQIQFKLNLKQNEKNLIDSYGIYCDNKIIVIADYSNPLIHLFDLNGNLIKSIKTTKIPLDVFIFNHLIYCTLQYETFIEIKSQDEKVDSKLQLKTKHQLYSLVITNEMIFICHSNDDYIGCYSHKNGDLLYKWGKYGKNESEFDYPYYLSIYNEQIYVTDSYNYRIQVFDLKGKFIKQWGKEGKNDGEFTYPYGIHVFNNLVFVVDKGNYRIQVFDLNGKFVTKYGEKGDDSGKFNDYLWDLSINENGNLIVGDWNRVQMFSIKF